MKIVGSMLVALLLESSLIGCELLSQHQPVSLSANFALGKESKELGQGSGDPKGGYIGMILNQNKVTGVFAGSPAEIAGITIGDKIMDIDKQSVFGEKTLGVADKLVGRAGTEVDLIVEHGDLLRKFCIIRAKPTAEEVIAIGKQNEWLKSAASGEITNENTY